MSSGTLTLTNNSAAVAGSGTAFSTDLAVGDFIVVTVGGIPYTLPVKAINSNTSLTLVSNFTGPTQSGAAWSAVPRVALNMVTAALVTQSAEALRGLNYDKQNWQSIFSGTGNVTVKLPDGSTFTGPSWNGINTTLNGKADKASLGNSATRNVGTTSGTVAAGNDSRFSTVDGMSGGNVTSGITVPSGQFFQVAALNASSNNSMRIYNSPANQPTGQYVNYTEYWWFDGFLRTGIRRGSSTNILNYSISMNVNDGTGATRGWTFNADGTATGGGAWNVSSDERHKSNLVEIQNALEAIEKVRGVTYSKLDSERRWVGLVSQDVKAVCPEAVTESESPVKFSDGTVIENFQTLDISGFTAAYAIQAIKELHTQVKSLQDDIEILKSQARES